MNTDRKLLYGYTPEQYSDRLAKQRSIAAMPAGEDGFSTSGSGYLQSWEESYLKRLLAANDQLEPDDPQSPIQRNNQPMASNISTNWKDDDGNYTPAVAFSAALLDDKTGGSFKNTLNNQGDGDDRQEWLNNHYGGRGLGYMGQNKFHRQPSAYGPGTTYNMDERKANVQANALRFFRSRGYRV